MKKHTKIFRLVWLLLFLIPAFAFSQLSIRDSIITTPLFNDKYEPFADGRNEKIAALLLPHSLSDLVSSGVISRTDMHGFSLPMGVSNNFDSVDFTIGMIHMWQKKGEWIQKDNSSLSPEVLLLSLKYVEKMHKGGQKTTLSEFRNGSVQQALVELQKLHSEMQPLYSENRKIFMDIIVVNLTANVLLGYSIQELIPPTHMTASGEVLSINPLFKSHFYDRLLIEAGESFIEGFPARYDNLVSIGPYQLTHYAIDDIKENNRLVKNFNKFESVESLNSIDDHVLAAALFAYNNWERLSMVLNSKELITKFNTYFADYKTNSEKARSLCIIIAGITACMHHQPGPTRTFVVDYIDKNTEFGNIHYDCVENYGAGKQLKKYYRSSAEAYLFLEVWDGFEKPEMAVKDENKHKKKSRKKKRM